MVTVGGRPGPVLVGADTLGASPEQRYGTAGIAAVSVRQADRDLGESLPQVALERRRGLPRRLEDLVRVKREPGAQQLVGQSGRVGPGQREIVRNARLALGGPGPVEWSA